ncbi:TolC family protein [Lujinxingia vulgaris]|uniref:TolC family protein n=1 Tax=Lujinxingia vulgaris TaxID=2600176 RepID=A0A5C6WYB8_9DELT|nr:TolC family protein [Lujinxingia vulgaris]TXD33751.1 TolC family protein [Lujinxingia vulgaris]
MHRRLAVFAACALVASAATWPQAARAESPPELRLSSVIDYARCTAPTFHEASLDTEAARGELRAGERLLSEGVELGVSAGPRFLPGSAESPQADIGVEVGLPLGRPGDRARRIEEGEANLALSERQAELADLGAIRGALMLYREAATRAARLALAEKRLELSRRLSEVAAARAESGESGALEAELAALRYEREAAEVARQRARQGRLERRLATVLGLETIPEDGANTEAVARATLPTAAELERVQEALQRSETISPRAAELRARAEALRAQARAQRAERWPSLNLNLGAEREGSEALAAHLGLGFAFGSGAERRALSDALQAAAERAETLAQAEQARAEARTRATADLLARLREHHRHWEDELLPRHLAMRERYLAAYEAGALPLNEILTLERELSEAEDAQAALVADLLSATTEALELLNFHHPDAPGAEEVICER